MNITPERLQKCNIRQAADWIAFKLTPTTPLFEGLQEYIDAYNAPDYETRASNALIQLRIALFKGLLTATGEVGETQETGKVEYQRINIPTTETQQIDFFVEPYLAMPGNIIILDTDSEFARIYENVEFDVESLMRVFPHNKPYKSIYQTIMEDVILSQGITDENQGNVESLKIVFETAMKKYGVPESKILASKMPTLIRQPESQKGKALETNPARKNHNKRTKKAPKKRPKK